MVRFFQIKFPLNISSSVVLIEPKHNIFLQVHSRAPEITEGCPASGSSGTGQGHPASAQWPLQGVQDTVQRIQPPPTALCFLKKYLPALKYKEMKNLGFKLGKKVCMHLNNGLKWLIISSY